RLTAIAIDMETATLFIVGHHNQIPRGALLLVSDRPMTPEGIKPMESDTQVTADWADVHLEIGIDAMTDIGRDGETIKHFTFYAAPEEPPVPGTGYLVLGRMAACGSDYSPTERPW